jgi:hypothetical protein
MGHDSVGSLVTCRDVINIMMHLVFLIKIETKNIYAIEFSAAVKICTAVAITVRSHIYI